MQTRLRYSSQDRTAKDFSLPAAKSTILFGIQSRSHLGQSAVFETSEKFAAMTTGTLPYMAPEVFAEMERTAPGDIGQNLKTIG